MHLATFTINSHHYIKILAVSVCVCMRALQKRDVCGAGLH